MDKVIEHFNKQLGSISNFGGVNHVLLIENLKVNNQLIKHLARIGGRNRIEIMPYNVQNLQDINRVCTAAGYSSYIASKTSIVINVPVLDNEDKVRIEKQVRRMAEEAKVSVRNVRRKFKVSDKITRKYVCEIDNLVNEKLKILKDL